jgi:thiol-disulfide isomerase/thioredoxin
MKKNIGTILFVVVLAAVITGAYLLYTNLNTAPAASETAAESGGSPAPEAAESDKTPAADFTVYDADGNEVSLSDFIGEPVVVNFWASWCSYCKSEMPEFDEAYAQYGDDVVFMMIDVTDGSHETQANGAAYVAGKGYSFPVYFDTGLDATYAYNITGLPTSLFIDADGNLVSTKIGAITADELTQQIEAIIPG